MGEETTQFASRFTRAVELLGRIATERGLAAERRSLGDELEAAVAGSLDAIAALHEADTAAVRRWEEQRAEVLARVAELRAALARGGVDAVGRAAAPLVALLGSARGAGAPGTTGEAARRAVKRGARRKR
jgi:hypothetical protein